MPQGNPKPGELYLHFKQKLYQIVTVARHSETGEELVIYQALYDSFQTYARPLAMFISPVDRDRYPDAGQTYRFQLVEPASLADSDEVPMSPKFQSDLDGKPTGRNPSAPKSPEEKLMAFFDAKTMEERYEILLDMRENITDRMINNMAVVLDVVIEEGPLEQRYEELKTCVRTFQRYEINR
ncbi:MAG: DUF1653 domain-containing protein [Lachnospiraceae bacterium]|nr:DUF1653 domain-containing protein [Lachnospiraceae bacterium]